MVTQRGSRYSRPVLLLATLDFKNVFNSLRLNDKLNALEYTFSATRYILAMISNCLSNSQLVYNTSAGTRVKHITSGAAQVSIGPENGCFMYRVSISYSFRPSYTYDSRHIPCGSAGGRAKSAERQIPDISGKTPLQNGNDDRSMKTEEGGQRDLSRT